MGGSTPSKDRPEFWGGDVPWVSPKDMKVERIADSIDHVTEAAVAESSLRPVPVGSVLMVVRGMILAHTVPVALTEAPVTVNQDMKALVPESRVSGLYLRYCLQAHQDLLLSLVEEAGHGTRCLRSEQWRKFEVAVPPLLTQKAIADFLDHKTAAIDDLIAKKQRLLDLLTEKRAALINQAVTKGLDPGVPMKNSGIPWVGEIPAHWEIRPSRHLVDQRRPIMYGIVLPGPHVDNGVPIVKANNCRPGRLNLDLMKRTTAAIEARYARSRLCPGDVVIAIRGSVGSAAIIPPDLYGANLTQDAARLAPSERLGTRWIHYLTMSCWFDGFLSPRITGATVKGINIWDLARTPLPDVPVPEQEKIAAWLDGHLSPLQRLATQTTTSIERLQEYRQALITAAVTGKLNITHEFAA
jgi:type I restriction enzyme S subunit